MLCIINFYFKGWFLMNCSSAHQMAHQRADERLTRLKWPWERLYNCGEDSVDLTEESATSQNDHQRSVSNSDDDDDDNSTSVMVIVILLIILYNDNNNYNNGLGITFLENSESSSSVCSAARFRASDEHGAICQI